MLSSIACAIPSIENSSQDTRLAAAARFLVPRQRMCAVCCVLLLPCFIISGSGVLIVVVSDWCVWMQYDKDNDGHIDAAEFKFMCMDLGSPSRTLSHNHSQPLGLSHNLSPQFSKSGRGSDWLAQVTSCRMTR